MNNQINRSLSLSLAVVWLVSTFTLSVPVRRRSVEAGNRDDQCLRDDRFRTS